MHTVLLDTILPAQASKQCPHCLADKSACPPEDCGGIPGYQTLIEIIHNSQHKEHQSRLDWLGRKFKPELFNVESVRFLNPKKRLEGAILA